MFDDESPSMGHAPTPEPHCDTSRRPRKADLTSHSKPDDCCLPIEEQPKHASQKHLCSFNLCLTWARRSLFALLLSASVLWPDDHFG
ncbi:hypothetical protein P153DRAFT_386342 [Dothidotthia symphoricarpi CBS 119687]|uniref:Uncharacterized protein n=1 Tax=Dothidotthia symphoricarpi CBS 119687 TaxID=1392245 RepID=A0A6A6ABJ9_9PLEO|nr:uncharacterized protein P153DRAFT_386342 [Dothidotthia symphoricarpi CBS 119687]KAF2129159.1 hypothetical protein P153DRAFT_386342 [Dothidotthia symphoricarpi CBS 119687]